MKLFYGLGNPGAKYARSRHNLGQNVINKLIAKLALPVKNSPKFKAVYGQTGDSLLAVSTDYMNLSGFTAQKLTTFFKILPADLFVIHDDLDLPVGKYRIQFDRGPAGHNGIISIIDHLGTQAFHRIRIGIGHPLDSTPVEDYVLRSFTPDEKVIIDETIDKIVDDLIKQMGH